MYVRTEVNTEYGKIIEVHDDYHHPRRVEIYDHRDGCYSELYEKLYVNPSVKPVGKTTTWQLYVERLNHKGEIYIALFPTVKEANEALDSFKWAQKYGEGLGCY